MNITPEMESSIQADLTSIEKFEFTYKNGGQVIGSVKKIKFSPLKITILKNPVPKGESSKHKVVFDHLVKFSLHYKDGSTRSFE